MQHTDLTKGLYPEYIRNSSKSIGRKQPNKKWVKYLNRDFTKQGIQMPITYEKMLNTNYVEFVPIKFVPIMPVKTT